MTDTLPPENDTNIPRNVALIAAGIVIVLVAIVGIIIVLTTGGNPEIEESTLVIESSPRPTATNAATTPTVVSEVTAVAVDDGPTATLQPYEYTVQPGETLLFIIQTFGYRDTSIIPELLVLNGLPNENSIQEGQTLLIPRQSPTPGPSATPTLEVTETPTPAGLDETAAALATQGIEPTETPVPPSCTFTSRCITDDGQYYRHIVSAGETAAGIVFQYNTRYDDFISVNRLSASDPVLQVGQELLVPILITPTPTLTPTGGPDSTATPTPTSSPPTLLAPENNVVFERTEIIVLQWVPTTLLQSNQQYLVEVREANTGEILLQETTHGNSLRLPDDLVPGVGDSIIYSWRVVIVEGQNFGAPVSGQATIRQFTWGGE